MRGGGGRGGRGFSGGGRSFRSGVDSNENVKMAAACGKSSTSNYFVKGGEVDERYRNYDTFKTYSRAEKCQHFMDFLEEHLRVLGINGRLRPCMLPFFEENLAGCPDAANLKNLVISDAEYKSYLKSKFGSLKSQ